MTITLPDLPYSFKDLEPHISENTLGYHYGKHHKGYVDKTNKKIKGTALENATLEEIIRESHEADPGLFNVAAQAWNHDFYWKSMKPKGGGAPAGDVAAALKDTFDDYDALRKVFSEAAAGQFGSGWAWLVFKEGQLEIRTTANAETPLIEAGCVPLVTMDVWEHAYYLDYQNRRADYIAAFLDHLVNWDFASENLKKA